MSLQKLREWAQSQINNTAKPEVRPDIGISVLQIIDELENLEPPPSKQRSPIPSPKSSSPH
jgi:hypothetical protein